MAKNFGKLVLLSAFAGVVAAGTYHYLQNRTNTARDDFDDFDDADDFDEDLDDEDFSSDTTASAGSKIHTLPIDIDNAKEIIGEKVIEKLDRTKEKIDKAMEIISEITAPTAEPVYIEMDMSTGASASAAYSEPSGGANPSEEIFNDGTK